MRQNSIESPRIGIDFHTFDGIYQGSRSHILGIFSAAIEQASHLQFVFFLENINRLQKVAPVFSNPNVQLVKIRHILGPIRLAFQLPYLRYRYQIDLLHMQYRIPPIPLGPCAVTIHDLLFESHPQFFSKTFIEQSRRTFKFSAQKSELLFTVSDFSKSEISQRFDIEPEKIHVLHNAVNELHFNSESNGFEKIRYLGLKKQGYILTVGRLEPRKNHVNLLRAYSQLPEDTPPLIIAGQKDYGWESIFDLVSSLGLSSRVRFYHDIDDIVLQELLRHALFFVYPTYAEGFGMPVLEAMASGTAVVTSNTTSLPEVAGDGALYVDPSSPDDISQKMSGLLSDIKLRESLIAKARVQVQKFSWHRSASKLVNAYNDYFDIKI